MAYTRDELYQQMLASYAAQDLEGELVELAANILADYLYLHQMEDVSILLEDSFLRSKLLSSKIQHAADNFYSVYRGQNKLMTISNLGVLNKDMAAKRFDTIATYGQYKLIYAQDVGPFTEEPSSVTIQAYLCAEPAQTVTVRGNGKFYIDIEDSEGNLIENISEDLIVVSLDDGGTVDTSDDKVHELKISSSLSDLYIADTNAAVSGGNGMRAEICAMTLPNYGVRLWCQDKFKENYSYIISFLKCPDPTKPEIVPSKVIKSIPGFTMNVGGDTVFETVEGHTQAFKEDDPDGIYLAASNSQRFQSTMKSINSIDELIEITCKEFKGFNTVIGAQTIKVYYMPRDLTESVIGHADEGSGATGYYKDLGDVLKAYNITDTIELWSSAIKYLKYDDAQTSQLHNLYIDISYSDIIDMTKCEEIVNAPKYVVGKDFNPYQIISDLMSDESLLGKIASVQVYMKENDQESGTVRYPPVITLSESEHIEYVAVIKYESARK